MGMGIHIPMGFPWDSHGNESSFWLLMGMGMGIVLMGMGMHRVSVFISYLCQLFFRHVVGQALPSVSYSDITFLVR